jgi:hypothetical protein
VTIAPDLDRVQTTMREVLISGVEEITGRTVVAFMSDNHLEPDMPSRPSCSGRSDEAL